MTFPQAPALPEELDKLMRRMRLPYMRKAAPDVLATARAQRCDPAEVLRLLISEEVTGRDAATRRLRRHSANFPTGKTLASWRAEDSTRRAGMRRGLPARSPGSRSPFVMRRPLFAVPVSARRMSCGCPCLCGRGATSALGKPPDSRASLLGSRRASHPRTGLAHGRHNAPSWNCATAISRTAAAVGSGLACPAPVSLPAGWPGVVALVGRC